MIFSLLGLSTFVLSFSLRHSKGCLPEKAKKRSKFEQKNEPVPSHCAVSERKKKAEKEKG